MSKKSIPVFVNPLKIIEWEPRFHPQQSSETLALRPMLYSLCSLDAPSDIPECRNRYEQLSEFDHSLFVSIEEPEIKKNLFDPLRQAKTNYILGSYVGSIALCGIVAEKLAILIFIINKPDQNELRNFNERYSQEDRVERLKTARFIEKQSEIDFTFIRKSRRSWLHHWNTSEERTAAEAVQTYAAATRLVKAATDFRFVNVALTMNPKLWEYLECKGVISARDEGK